MEAAEQEARKEARASEDEYWQRRMAFTTRELTPREAAVKDMLADKDADIEVARNEVRYLKMLLKEARAAGDGDLRAMKSTPADQPAPQMVRASKAVPLLATFDEYAADAALKPLTKSEWRATIEKLKTFIGHDDAASLTADDIDRWLTALRSETSKRGGPRAARTIKGGYLTPVRATLAWAKEKRKLTENVAAAITVRIPRAVKLRDKDFTAAEAKVILSAALLATPGEISEKEAFARRWVPWLCAYTGARVNEISQLRGEDVGKVDGVWTIRITPEAGTVKTNTARIVPLHSHLAEQGFPEIAQAKGEGPLFYDPALRKSKTATTRQFKKVGERLAKWVRKGLGITDPSLQPNHAWRHTFKTKANAAGIPERVVDAIQGHAPASVSRSYGSTPLATMEEAIERLPRFEV